MEKEILPPRNAELKMLNAERNSTWHLLRIYHSYAFSSLQLIPCNP